jgi:transcriptional regulator with XRE-family HTH domain
MSAPMTSAKNQVMKALQDKEYRTLYVDENISTGIAVQLRELREAKRWTQARIGEYAGGIRQERISQLEDPNYGRPTLTTLKRLAAALDVALIVRFAPFGELVDWTLNLTPDRLAPPSFDDEIERGYAVTPRPGSAWPSDAAGDYYADALTGFWNSYVAGLKTKVPPKGVQTDATSGGRTNQYAQAA